MVELTLENISALLDAKLKGVVTAEELNDTLDKRFAEMHEFLAKRFEKIDVKMAAGFSEIRQEMDNGFSELHLKLDFVRKEIETIKKDLAELSKRTKEDDDAFATELLSLKKRVGVMEKAVYCTCWDGNIVIDPSTR